MEEEEYINSDNFKMPRVEVCEPGEQIAVRVLPIILSHSS